MRGLAATVIPSAEFWAIIDMERGPKMAFTTELLHRGKSGNHQLSVHAATRTNTKSPGRNQV